METIVHACCPRSNGASTENRRQVEARKSGIKNKAAFKILIKLFYEFFVNNTFSKSFEIKKSNYTLLDIKHERNRAPVRYLHASEDISEGSNDQSRLGGPLSRGYF